MFLKTIMVEIFRNEEKNQTKFDETRKVYALFRSFMTTSAKNPILEDTGQ